jgi:hypothetical protein
MRVNICRNVGWWRQWNLISWNELNFIYKTYSGIPPLLVRFNRKSNQSQSHFATNGQSISKWGSWPDIYYLLFDSYGLVLWGALSDERTVLSFVYAAGPHQRSLSRIRFPRDSWPHFTVSDSRLPFSSPSTTLRITVEVFDPASTRVTIVRSSTEYIYTVTGESITSQRLAIPR